jgi:hypothetical protein
MPHILLSHTAVGPLIDVYVTASLPRIKALQAAGSPLPPTQFCKALVDTGASHTSIDPTIVSALGLTPTGSAPIITPTTGNTPVMVPTFDVGVHVAFSNQQFHSKNPTTVTSCVLIHQGFAVLFGRDLLGDGMMVFDGKHGVFTVSF